MNPQTTSNNQQPAAMPKTAPSNPASPSTSSGLNSTQNTLQIAEIRDGIVIMNDGTFRAVIMCKSINFDLMSPQEREAVEFSYQGFLNSLNFPIQIFMRSEKVDLRPYLEKLDKISTTQNNMLLGLLMEDYIDFLAAIAQQSNIMNKQFYLIVGYPDLNQDVRSTVKQSTGFFTGLAGLFGQKNKAPHVVVDEKTLSDAKTELRNRVQAVIEGLMQCGVQALPLDTQELIELYYNTYNPDTATHQQLENFDTLNTEVITKGHGRARQPQLDAGGDA